MSMMKAVPMAMASTMNVARLHLSPGFRKWIPSPMIMTAVRGMCKGSVAMLQSYWMLMSL
jgi:hypothetical protein